MEPLNKNESVHRDSESESYQWVRWLFLPILAGEGRGQCLIRGEGRCYIPFMASAVAGRWAAQLPAVQKRITLNTEMAGGGEGALQPILRRLCWGYLQFKRTDHQVWAKWSEKKWLHQSTAVPSGLVLPGWFCKSVRIEKSFQELSANRVRNLRGF